MQDLDDPQVLEFIRLSVLRMRLSDTDSLDHTKKFAAQSEVERHLILKFLELEQVQSVAPEGRLGKIYMGVTMLLDCG